MGALQPWHWVVLIIVVILLFGGSLLPRLGRFFGKSVTSLKQGFKDSTEEFKTAVKPPEDKTDIENRTGGPGTGGPSAGG